GAATVLSVMPSHVCHALYEQMLGHLRPEMIFVSATKGLDTERLMRMSEVIKSVVGARFPPRVVALSGPTFAREVARGDPTAIVQHGKRQKLADIVGAMRMVAEGVKTTYAAVALARRHGVEMPITEQVHRLLEGQASPREAIRELMERPPREE